MDSWASLRIYEMRGFLLLNFVIEVVDFVHDLAIFASDLVVLL